MTPERKQEIKKKFLIGHPQEFETGDYGVTLYMCGVDNSDSTDCIYIDNPRISYQDAKELSVYFKELSKQLKLKKENKE